MDDHPNTPAGRNSPPTGRRNTDLLCFGNRLCLGGAILLIIVGGLSLLLTCCRAVRRGPAEVASIPSSTDVKVRLVHGKEELHLEALGPHELTGEDGRELSSGERSRTYVLDAARGDLRVDEHPVPTSTITLETEDDIFELEGSRYRGRLTVSMADTGEGLTAYEEVPLEDYVRAVLPSELPARWPMAALEAQAIAIRSFALHRNSNSNGRRWISRMDLAYRGAEAETRRTDEAVRSTAGQILQWEDRPLPAFFHSTCGGHTVSAEEVFGEHDVEPLQGQKCGQCEDSPRYRWETSIPREELIEQLEDRGVDRINNLEVVSRTDSGRVESVSINGHNIPAPEFRLAVGPQRIKSTDFTVTPAGRSFVFKGKGWGHGIGLCQWGARGFAEDGYSAPEILRHYYPESQLTADP
ncbi:MAG: SpoIID/LytB domain-containing protein [Planctomycetota bacterium]